MLPHSFSGMSPTEYSFPLAHRLPDFGDVIHTAVSDSISEAAGRGRERGIRPERPGIRSIPGEIHARAIRTHTARSEEHTSELQSRLHLVCRLLLEKKKKI